MFFLIESLSLRFFGKMREAVPIVSSAGTETKRELAEVRS
jgi:hypothetical protein